MDIKLCNDTDGEEWDAFVNLHSDSTFFHYFGWKKILEISTGHKTYYLAAYQNEKILGLLPLINVKSALFGNVLSSLAFGSYGGAVGESREVCAALEQEAVSLGTKLGVGSVEFRCLNETDVVRPKKDLYERFVKEIFPTEDENMQAIRGKQRNIIRKGIKKGLQVSTTSDCNEFYGVYAESVRNLGTPVFPKALFQSILDMFPETTEIVTAHLNGQPVSSALVYYFKEEVCPYYWGGTYLARNLAGNDFLTWSILCRAAEKGATRFDFGRSKKDTGSRQWKVNLGFEPQQLYYEYELIRDKEMPSINPLNPKYRFFVEAWKKLPLPIASKLGPFLSKNLG